MRAATIINMSHTMKEVPPTVGMPPSVSWARRAAGGTLNGNELNMQELPSSHEQDNTVLRLEQAAYGSSSGQRTPCQRMSWMMLDRSTMNWTEQV